MSRVTVILASKAQREQAAKWCLNAPLNCRVEFKQAKRSLPQNARMWLMLTAVARVLPWHGVKLSAEDWKLLFLDALKAEVRMVPNLNGNGFTNIGRSSSDLSKEEMGDMMTLIEKFAAERGVQLGDEDETQSEAA